MVHARIEQAQGELRLPEAPVEAVDELVEIFLRIPAGDPVERAQQVSLEIADGDVHPKATILRPAPEV